MHTLTRRTLLKISAAALPAFALGCRRAFEPELVPESTARFPRTPIAGDMTQTRIVIAFHVADDSPVTLRLWTDLETVVVDQEIQPSGDGFHKVMVDDLLPGTAYQYALFFGKAPNFEDRSLICAVKTAHADDSVLPVRLALVSCIGQGSVLPDFYFPESTGNETKDPFMWEIFTHAADKELDAIVHLGDQGYLDFVWSAEEVTTESYLHAWGFYHGGGYRDLYPLAGLYTTWDDHEATDNKQFDPWDLTEEESAKLKHAKDAWYKVMPIDAHTPEEKPVWRNFRWGKTLELILLDCRYELEEEHLMSEAQLSWLLQTLKDSPCRFICVATPKPFCVITSSKELLADNADRWDGYPDDRQRLTDVLDELQGTDVLFVAGDIHMNYLGQGSLTGDAPSDKMWEVCCTSGNRNPLADSLSPEQFVFVDPSPHFPVLTFDPETDSIHVAFYGKDGTLNFEQTLTS